MARQTLPTGHHARTTAVLDEPSGKSFGTPHFAARSGMVVTKSARGVGLPSRFYVMVVISLAVFVVGLTFWCHPDIRHEVVGQVRIVHQQGAAASENESQPEASTGQLQEILSRGHAWAAVCQDLGIDPAQAARPSFEFRHPSDPADHWPGVIVKLDESRPELAIRLVNRYLQEIVEQFEHLQLGAVEPAVLTSVQAQVDSARADRDRVQVEFDQLTARLTTQPSEAEAAEREPSQSNETESSDLLAARRRLEAQLAEANRSLDAAVDLQRELQQRTTLGSGLHLIISHPGRLAARRASPLRAEQLVWLFVPSVVCGLLAGWAVPRSGRGATLRTVEQVQAISPFPVIAMRRDAAQAGPGLPHHLRRHRRRAPWLHRLVRVSEITVMLAIVVVISYGWTAAGYRQRLLENPFAAYSEAAAVTLGQWHAF